MSLAPSEDRDDGRVSDAHRLRRVEAVWGAPPPIELRAGWSKYPMAHPVIAANTNRAASGRPDNDAYGRLHRLLLERGVALPVARAASLGCGTGSLERRLAVAGFFSRCYAFDLAESALEAASTAAAAEGVGSLISFVRKDFELEDIGEGDLDLVLAHQSVHHVKKLEKLFDSVHASMKPGGILHLHEFVGPNHLQWTDRQMEEITTWLRSVPERLRRSADGELKTGAGRPTVAEMLEFDPTEAVRSADIERVVSDRFELIEKRALGGTLSSMALADIAHNFDPDVPEDVGHLSRLLGCEDALIRAGEIGSDFMTLTYVRT